MGFNRILRRMGLPGWTFLGVAVSATIIFYGGKALEQIFEVPFEEFTPRMRNLLTSLLLIFAAFLLMLLAWLWQKKEFNLRAMHIIGGDLTLPSRKRGLIILVSNANSALHAVRHHLEKDGKGLERVWLIPSNERRQDEFGASSLALAKQIKEECLKLAKDQGVTLRVDINDPGVSPADAQDTFESVNRIFRLGSFKPGEIIADFSGGTKPMTVGMIMACLPRERELEYVPFNPLTKTMHGPYLIDYEHSAFDLVG